MSNEIVVAFGMGATVTLILMLIVWTISDRQKEREEIYRMTAKEYLENVRQKRVEIESLKAELAYLRDNMDMLNGIDYAAPRVISSPEGDTGIISIIARMQHLEHVLAAKIDVYTAQLFEAECIIRCVSDDVLRAILIDRYINNMTPQEIADKMGYTERHIFTLLKDALSKIILPKHFSRFQ
ncbi:MAG: hypothetical protein IJK23_09875 [Clostridia bacterium]|nr:hypothetical protein [Clostridia bacterium]